MPELRIDPLSGHRTIVAGERSFARQRMAQGALIERPRLLLLSEVEPVVRQHHERAHQVALGSPGGGPEADALLEERLRLRKLPFRRQEVSQVAEGLRDPGVIRGKVTLEAISGRGDDEGNLFS